MTTIDMARRHEPPTPAFVTRRVWPRALAVWVFAAVLLGVLVAGFMNFDGVALLWAVPVDAIVLAVACTAMMDVIYAARWRIWLTPTLDRCPFSLVSLWTFVTWSRVASQVLPVPAGSLGVRAASVKTAGNLTVRQAMFSVAIDPMLDLYQFLLMLPVTVALILGYASAAQAAAAGAGMLLFGAFVLATLHPYLLAAFTWIRRCVGSTGKRDVDGRLAALNPRRADLLTAYALTVVRFVFVGMRIWAVAIAVGMTTLSPLYAMCTGTVTQAAHMATLTPGALGVLEGGWFAVLRASGYAAHDATLFVTAQRLLLWVALATIAAALSTAYVLARARNAREGTAAPRARSEPT